MTKRLLMLSAAALLVLGAACGKKATTNTAANENNIPPVVINMSDNTTVNAAANGNVSVNKNTNTASSGPLVVSKPAKNEELGSPYTVSGTSSADKVYVRVNNSAGTPLFLIPATVRNGAFSVNVTFEFTHTSAGTIEVFEKDTGNNEINLVSIPVTFKTTVVVNANTTATANTNTSSNSNYSY